MARRTSVGDVGGSREMLSPGRCNGFATLLYKAFLRGDEEAARWHVYNGRSTADHCGIDMSLVQAVLDDGSFTSVTKRLRYRAADSNRAKLDPAKALMLALSGQWPYAHAEKTKLIKATPLRPGQVTVTDTLTHIRQALGTESPTVRSIQARRLGQPPAGSGIVRRNSDRPRFCKRCSQESAVNCVFRGAVCAAGHPVYLYREVPPQLHSSSDEDISSALTPKICSQHDLALSPLARQAETQETRSEVVPIRELRAAVEAAVADHMQQVASPLMQQLEEPSPKQASTMVQGQTDATSPADTTTKDTDMLAIQNRVQATQDIYAKKLDSVSRSLQGQLLVMQRELFGPAGGHAQNIGNCARGEDQGVMQRIESELRRHASSLSDIDQRLATEVDALREATDLSVRQVQDSLQQSIQELVEKQTRETLDVILAEQRARAVETDELRAEALKHAQILRDEADARRHKQREADLARQRREERRLQEARSTTCEAWLEVRAVHY